MNIHETIYWHLGGYSPRLFSESKRVLPEYSRYMAVLLKHLLGGERHFYICRRRGESRTELAFLNALHIKGASEFTPDKILLKLDGRRKEAKRLIELAEHLEREAQER